MQYIDISGLSPSYNYIRGWLISKTNPSEPLTSSAGHQPGRSYYFSFSLRKRKEDWRSIKDWYAYLLLLIGQNSPGVFTFISQVFVPLQFISLVMEDRSDKFYSRHFPILKSTTKNAFLKGEIVIQMVNVETWQPKTRK